jgi:predicted RNA-binding protein
MDYKALYEQELQKNKELKEHLMQVMEDGKHLIIQMGEEYVEPLKKENEELKEKIKKIRAEDGPYSAKAQEALIGVAREVIAEKEKIQEKLEQVTEDKNDLLSFIGGNFDYEEKVKKHIKEFYTQEFIDCNAEQWAQVCIDWGEDSDDEGECSECGQQFEHLIPKHKGKGCDFCTDADGDCILPHYA